MKVSRKKCLKAQHCLEDPELQNEVTDLLNQLGKRDSCWSSWDFSQVIKRLGTYSLIEYDPRNCVYSLNPLVQHWSGTTIGSLVSLGYQFRGHSKTRTSNIGIACQPYFKQHSVAQAVRDWPFNCVRSGTYIHGTRPLDGRRGARGGGYGEEEAVIGT